MLANDLPGYRRTDLSRFDFRYARQSCLLASRAPSTNDLNFAHTIDG
jgi:hypothetical protein